MKNSYKLIYEAIVGSHSYGTSIEGISDIDKKGIYIQPLKDLLSFSRYKPQIELTKDHSIFEVKRFLELLKTANPTMLELLYSPSECILVKDSIFDILLKNRDKFLTKACRDSFGGYAVQQIKKASGLNKKCNWEADKITRKTPLDFCTYVDNDDTTITQSLKNFLETTWYTPVSLEKCFLVKSSIPNCFDLYLTNNPEFYIKNGYKIFGIIEENSNELKYKNKEIIEELNKLHWDSDDNLKSYGIVHYNKDGYSKHCKDYLSYQEWLKERNEDRYKTNKEHGQNYDSKNLMHLRRLLDMAKEIAQEGSLKVKRPNREELLKIRRGEVNLEEILYKAQEDLASLDSLYESSQLSERVSEDFIDEILLEIRESYVYLPSF